MRRAVPALMAAVFLFCTATAFAADLRVRIQGLRSDDGTVHVALWDDPAGFPDDDRMLGERVVPAARAGVEALFEGLAPGTYAVATYHDENDDGSFDQNFLGLPLEGYAFSNDVRPFLSPPPFAAAAVAVGEGLNTIVITMVY